MRPYISPAVYICPTAGHLLFHKLLQLLPEPSRVNKEKKIDLIKSGSYWKRVRKSTVFRRQLAPASSLLSSPWFLAFLFFMRGSGYPVYIPQACTWKRASAATPDQTCWKTARTGLPCPQTKNSTTMAWLCNCNTSAGRAFRPLLDRGATKNWKRGEWRNTPALKNNGNIPLVLLERKERGECWFYKWLKSMGTCRNGN